MRTSGISLLGSANHNITRFVLWHTQKYTINLHHTMEADAVKRFVL